MAETVPAVVADIPVPNIPADAEIERYSDEILSQINSMQDALDLGPADDWDNYGSGFVVLDDKSKLIKTPFRVIEWQFNHSDEYDGLFVSVAIAVPQSGNLNDLTGPADKFILNDGSTGIFKQLVGVTNRRIVEGWSPSDALKGLLIRRGLRVSRYSKEMPDGKTIQAETYYLG